MKARCARSTRRPSPSTPRTKSNTGDPFSNEACIARLQIPAVLREATAHLELNGAVNHFTCLALTLDTIGIREARLFENAGCFEKKVQQKTIEALRKKCIENSVRDTLDRITDPNIVAGLLLQFFREQTEPLLAFQLYDAWTNCAGACSLLC